MGIPDFQAIMLPLLELAEDGEIHSVHEAVGELADSFHLSEEERTELLPSGQQPTFYNRVGWARTYLKKAGLLADPRRGHFRITERGKKVLERHPSRIDKAYLQQFEEFVDFTRGTQDTAVGEDNSEPLQELTPEEVLENSYQQIRDDLAEELLDYVLGSGSGFFEKLVVELLVEMGYGGSRRDAARAVGRSGDRGIDGIIDEDRLGLDVVYVQAKKWSGDNPVGRPEIQKFVGALQGRRAKKGIFITTSRFTENAREYASRIDTRVVLIDGERLTDLMIDHGVGVSPLTTYEIKRVDSDYFGESTGDD